jgi:NAD-dependent SIR2 family protein deacetylase
MIQSECMTYYVPRPYKCPTCNTKFGWSIHHDPINLGEPYCPKCYGEFIKNNVPMGMLIDNEDS